PPDSPLLEESSLLFHSLLSEEVIWVVLLSTCSLNSDLVACSSFLTLSNPTSSLVISGICVLGIFVLSSKLAYPPALPLFPESSLLFQSFRSEEEICISSSLVCVSRSCLVACSSFLTLSNPTAFLSIRTSPLSP